MLIVPVPSDDRIGASSILPMPHVVTLCTGNAARSVIAGAVLADAPGLLVSTRGTHVIEGMPMSWRTADAIKALGASSAGHRSRQLTSIDLGDADLVLAMAGEHVEYVRKHHPDAAARTGTLRRLARDLPGATGSLAERIASLELADDRARTLGRRRRPGRWRSGGVPPLRG